jgi:hypothetical protein
MKSWLDGGRPGRWESIDASADPLGYLRFLDESRASDRDGSAGLLDFLGPLELEPGQAVLEGGCGTGLHLPLEKELGITFPPEVDSQSLRASLSRFFSIEEVSSGEMSDQALDAVAVGGVLVR